MSQCGFRFLQLFAALAFSLGVAACAGESRADPDLGGSSMAAETGEEHAEGGGPSEVGGEETGGEGSGGEHAEGGEGEGDEGREGEGEHGGEGGEGEGEHGGEEGEHDDGGEAGEEPGLYVARGDTWDMTRRGARLVLGYNTERGAFVGQVTNTTEQRLCAVRVEVHVGGGPELGPTARTNIPAGGTIEIVLPSEGASIDTWTAHPEISACPGG